MKIRPLATWLDGAHADESVVAFCAGEVRNHAQLSGDVRTLCARLQAAPQRRWALCCDDAYLFCVALLAVLHAGKVPVLPGHRRIAQLTAQAADFDAMLTDRAPASLPLSCPVWQLSAQAQEEMNLAFVLPAVPDNAWVTLYTSGSTGMPCKIDKPVSAMDQEARWLATLWGEHLQGCVVRGSVSHEHLYGLTFRIWLVMALARPFECSMVAFPEQLSVSGRERNVFITSPAFISRLDFGLPAPAMALVVSAGSVLTDGTAQAAKNWFGSTIGEVYGSTETGVLAWRERSQHSRQNDVWQPFPDVGFSRHADGQLLVTSPLLAQPHALDDELTCDQQGRFVLAGRRDRIVKIAEHRVSLTEIERRLGASDYIAEVAVLLIQRGIRQSLGAVIVLSETGLRRCSGAGWRSMIAIWRDALAGWLHPVALPRYWRVVTVMPLTAQGKRSMPELMELFNVSN